MTRVRDIAAVGGQVIMCAVVYYICGCSASHTDTHFYSFARYFILTGALVDSATGALLLSIKAATKSLKRSTGNCKSL